MCLWAAEIVSPEKIARSISLLRIICSGNLCDVSFHLTCMYPAGSSQSLTALEAMRNNLKQMHTYLKTYQEITKSLPRDQSEYLNLEIEQMEDILRSPQKFSADHIQKKFIKIMISARDMCRMVWARFNVRLMVYGICILGYWLMTIYVKMAGETTILNQKYLSTVMVALLCICVFVPNFLFVGDEFLGNIFSYATCILLICAFSCHILRLNLFIPNCSSMIAVFSVGIFSISFTSNSFILNEDYMTLYLFSSTLVLVTYFKHLNLNDTDYTLTKSSKLNKTDKSPMTILKDICWIPTSYISHSAVYKCCYVFVTLLCARVAFFFRTCRAEQFWCFEDDTLSMVASNTNVLFW